jgi:ketosteroid isomerase-like protein
MNDQRNLDAVHAIFAAFARNDLAAALAMLAEDVDWQNLGPAEMGYTTPRHGRERVRAFFAEVDALFTHDQFDPREFVAQGDKVAVAGTELVAVKPSGKPFVNHWCMIFTFDAGGKIARWRCYEDTATVLAEMRKLRPGQAT